MNKAFKSLRSLETGLNGLDEIHIDQEDRKNLFYLSYLHHLQKEFLYVAQAFRENIELNQIYESCKIDHWFLRKIQEIVHFETLIKKNKKNITSDLLYQVNY